MPLIALVLGYAENKPDHKAGRLKDLGIFHENKYKSLSDKEISEINLKYDDPNLSLGLNDNWKKNGHDLTLNGCLKSGYKENPNLPLKKLNF